MNINQNNKLAMYIRVMSVCKDNKTKWENNHSFNRNYDQLTTVIEKINKTQDKQGTVLTGITKNKYKIEEDLVMKALIISGSLQTWASENNNHEVKAKVDFSRSELGYVRDSETRTRTQIIYETAIEHVDKLEDFGVTGKDIEELKKLIDQFAEIIGKQGLMEEGSETATTGLVSLFTEGDMILRDRLDKLIIKFQEQDITFYNTYINSREIYDLKGGKSKTTETTKDTELHSENKL